MQGFLWNLTLETNQIRFFNIQAIDYIALTIADPLSMFFS